METKSRFSTTRFYLPLTVFTAFFLCGLYIGVFTDEHAAGDYNGNKQHTIIFALAMCFSALFGMYIFLWRGKKITISSGRVVLQSVFLKKVIDKDDLASIDIFARGTPGYFSSTGRTIYTGIRFTFKNGDDIFNADMYYNNVYEIKEALKASFAGLVIQPVAAGKTNKDIRATTITGAEERFSGNPFLTWHSLPLFFFLAVAVYSFYKINQGSRFNPASLLVFAPFIFAAAIFGNIMNYFLLSGSQLIIKNHIWWWRDKVYDINSIAEAIIETPYRQPNTLRLNFKDYSTKGYGAAPLRWRTWIALMHKLSDLGIVTKSESIWIKI